MNQVKKDQANPLQQSYEQSRVGVTFGDDFEKGPVSFRAEAHFNEQKAIDQYDYLKNIVGDHIDIDWSLVCFLRYQVGKKDALIESITKIKDRPRFEAFECKIHSDDTYVYFSVKLREDEESKLKGGLELILENGLREMVKSQDNYFNFEFDANYDFDQLVQAVSKGERVGAAFLRQIRAELNLFLTKNFYQGIEKFVQGIDQEALESPPLAFLKHFKNLDMDLRFRSTDELPQVIKNQMIFGEEFQTLAQEELQLPINRTKQVNAIMDAAADNGFIYFTISDLCAVKIESHTPKLSTFLTKYGKYLAKLVGLGEFVPEV
ncbi:unnamed protein product [Paramecium sonneborni]|uniref:Uncharacterized protein n=1 Tax=Paramecium sonneborni TaxID=65129 RepID=A0A8S1NA01_9CILI|nr:unnamed protein product [Paramecium sonneborni]